MRENIAKKRLYAGETLYGIFANAISPELIEIMGITGFDFIVVTVNILLPVQRQTVS